MAAAAVVCGRKRSHLYEKEEPPISKRFRHHSQPLLDNVKNTENAADPIEKAPQSAVEWVDSFVQEMGSASSLDDAKARAFKLLEALEKAVTERGRAAAREASIHADEEKAMLNERMEVLSKENAVLKRAVAFQHEKLKGLDEKEVEVEMLKKVVVECQERLRKAEVSNYALSMHLNQALGGGGSFHGHCNPPDVC